MEGLDLIGTVQEFIKKKYDYLPMLEQVIEEFNRD